jgi:uncharacterized ParB-like nuclease family protein
LRSRRATLKPETVREIARSMLEVGQEVPILVRRDGDRFVLVHGLHRLEACKALGEETISGSHPGPEALIGQVFEQKAPRSQVTPGRALLLQIR